MIRFKMFFEGKEEEKDIRSLLSEIPKKCRDLVKGYTYIFQNSNVLKVDKDHIGIVNPRNKTITISGPWNFSRSFVLLHEIGHLVYDNFVKGTDLEKEWETIEKNTKNKKKDENPVEQFCHAFANTYIDQKFVIHHHQKWYDFVKKVCST